MKTLQEQDNQKIDDGELSIKPGSNGEANIEPIKTENDPDEKLLEALREVQDWNDADISGFDDISPDMEMLKVRQDRIKEALADFLRCSHEA